MDIRKLVSSDYDDILVGWWKDWRWEPPTRDFLPDNGVGGFIVYDEDVPVCAGFMYITNSKVGWSEFIVSNINYRDKEKRNEALDLLIQSISIVLSDVGCRYVYTSLKNKSLVNAYARNGFVKGSEGCTEMVKIWQQ